MTDKKMTYDIDEMPPIGEALVLAYQHLFAMFGATILVPILVNAQAGEEVLTIPVALVSSGIGTLIYILCTGAKSPVYLGSSFAFIVPVAAAYMKSGLGGAMTGIMAVGLIYVVVSFIIRAVGEKWLEDLLPPVVIGPMIMIIGLGLAPSAVSQIGLTGGTQMEIRVVIVALVSFIVTAVVMTAARGFLKIIPFLVGITVGYIVAVVFGLVDFTAVYEASWFAVPQFKIIFRDYTPDFTALITIAPIALVTMCEHIGDHTSLSNIIGPGEHDLRGEHSCCRYDQGGQCQGHQARRSFCYYRRILWKIYGSCLHDSQCRARRSLPAALRLYRGQWTEGPDQEPGQFR